MKNTVVGEIAGKSGFWGGGMGEVKEHNEINEVGRKYAKYEGSPKSLEFRLISFALKSK